MSNAGENMQMGNKVKVEQGWIQPLQKAKNTVQTLGKEPTSLQVVCPQRVLWGVLQRTSIPDP